MDKQWKRFDPPTIQPQPCIKVAMESSQWRHDHVLYCKELVELVRDIVPASEADRLNASFPGSLTMSSLSSIFVPNQEHYLEKRSCQLFYYCVHMALPNDTAIQTRCLRSYVSYYVNCSVLYLVLHHVPGSYSPTIARPAGRMRVHCRLFVVAFSDVHARGTSFFGTASCMSCFGYFVSWPGLFRFGAAETSFRVILLNDR